MISMQQPRQLKLPKWSLTVTIPSTNRSCRVVSMETNAKANQPAAMLKVYFFLVTSQLSRHPFFLGNLAARTLGTRLMLSIFTREWPEKARFWKIKVFLKYVEKNVEYASGRESSPNETQVTVSDEFIWCFFFFKTRTILFRQKLDEGGGGRRGRRGERTPAAKPCSFEMSRSPTNGTIWLVGLS